MSNKRGSVHKRDNDGVWRLTSSVYALHVVGENLTTFTQRGWIRQEGSAIIPDWGSIVLEVMITYTHTLYHVLRMIENLSAFSTSISVAGKIKLNLVDFRRFYRLQHKYVRLGTSTHKYVLWKTVWKKRDCFLSGDLKR